MNRHEKALELDKILHMLAQETTCADAHDLALRLAPAHGLYEVTLYKKKQATRICSAGGSAPRRSAA